MKIYTVKELDQPMNNEVEHMLKRLDNIEHIIQEETDRFTKDYEKNDTQFVNKMLQHKYDTMNRIYQEVNKIIRG